MEPVAAADKEHEAAAINKSCKPQKSKEKRRTRIPPSEPSTSSSTANTQRTLPKEFSSNAGYGTTQLDAILEQTAVGEISEDAASLLLSDINYKLRHIIKEANTKTRLSNRCRMTSEDIDDTIQSLGEKNGFGIPDNPIWEEVNDFGHENLYFLEDSVVNLQDLARSTIEYIQSSNSVLKREYFSIVTDILKNYFKEICKAVVDENKEVRAIALKDIRINTSIGPIIEWLYNYSFLLLKKDLTYDGVTMYALEFLECLEVNPLSSQIVSEAQVKALTGILFQRLLKSKETPSQIKPFCHIITFMCRKLGVRKLMLNKMHIKNFKLMRFFIFPILCLANEMGSDAVSTIIEDSLPLILNILKICKKPNFINEALRAYYILCMTEMCTKDISDNFQNIYGDGIIPFWKNESYPSETLPSKCNWLNVKKKLYKSRRKVFPPPDYKQKTVSIKNIFTTNENVDEREKIRPQHQTNFKPNIKKSYFIIGKRALLSSVFNKNLNRSRCTYHSMMYHNL